VKATVPLPIDGAVTSEVNVPVPPGIGIASPACSATTKLRPAQSPMKQIVAASITHRDPTTNVTEATTSAMARGRGLRMIDSF